MELYDIIESLNRNIKNGRLILHRGMSVNNTFKVLKVFNYDLYLMKGEERTLINSTSFNVRALSDEIEEMWKKQDKIYLNVLIDWISSNHYKELTDV